MARPRKPIVSEMGWSTSDKIVVRGKDLPSEVLGHVNLGDMAFLEVMNRLPSSPDSPTSGRPRPSRALLPRECSASAASSLAPPRVPR
jgi:hypothetical protein